MTASTQQPGSDRPQGLDPEKLLAMGQTPTGETIYTRSGRGFTPPPIETIAAAFPDLEVHELLGSGGMGAVYRAVQPRLGRDVALKILPPELFPDPSCAERFTREARTLASLSHPNIVTVYDFGEQGGFYYLMMQCVDGLNLRQLLDMEKLSPVEALAIVPQICEALQYAHDHGIVHRDIKPENILMDQEGKVRIADFGLAKILGQEAGPLGLTRTHQVVGTPHYMAPEQIEQPMQVDHRADIFSLGVVFYEMLTGKLPLGRFDPPSKRGATGPNVDDVVMRSLEREPERRYQAAREVREHVENARQQRPEPASAPARSPAATVSPRLSMRALGGFLWLVIGSFFGLVASAAFWFMPRRAANTVITPDGIQYLEPESTAALPNTIVILVLLAFVMGGPILAATAIPAIRKSEGRLYGMGLAVFTSFILPLLALDYLACLPIGLIEDPSVRALVTGVVALGLLAMNIAVIIWTTRWQQRPLRRTQAAAA